MDVTSIASGASQASTASTGLAQNFDTFLKLLTTQLQNQDPLEPLDSNEFTAQLVQFTNVEQAIAANKNLETLVSLASTSSANAAVGYLGQQVTANGISAQLINGSAQWSYDLQGSSTATSLTVTDQNGIPVFTGQGATGFGQNTFKWDGLDNNGNLLPPGLYNLKVSATDINGNIVPTKTSVTGIVNSVSFEGTEPILDVNGVTVRLKDILTIVDTTNNQGSQQP